MKVRDKRQGGRGRGRRDRKQEETLGLTSPQVRGIWIEVFKPEGISALDGEDPDSDPQRPDHKKERPRIPQGMHRMELIDTPPGFLGNGKWLVLASGGKIGASLSYLKDHQDSGDVKQKYKLHDPEGFLRGGR